MAKQLNEGIGEKIVQSIFSAIAQGKEYSWMRRQQDPDMAQIIDELKMLKDRLDARVAKISANPRIAAHLDKGKSKK